MSKLVGVEQLFEGRHFDREVIILCDALVSLLQVEPARPAGDDGRTRPVASTYDHCALGVAIRTGVREALEAVRPGGRPVMEGGGPSENLPGSFFA
jgi:hypothetical protein